MCNVIKMSACVTRGAMFVSKVTVYVDKVNFELGYSLEANSHRTIRRRQMSADTFAWFCLCATPLLCLPPPPPTSSQTAEDFVSFFTDKVATFSSQISALLIHSQPTHIPLFSSFSPRLQSSLCHPSNILPLRPDPLPPTTADLTNIATSADSHQHIPNYYTHLYRLG